MAQFIPSIDFVPCAVSQEEMALARESLALSTNDFSGLGERFQRGLGWPNVILDIATARELLRAYGNEPGFSCVEASVEANSVEDLLANVDPGDRDPGPAPVALCGWEVVLRSRVAPSSSGVFAGNEPVALLFSSFSDSWLSCRTQLARGTIAPNRFGLVDSAADAEVICRRMSTSLSMPTFSWRLSIIAA